MKIGIVTFHWSTNYGAVLQSYALQEVLRELGHDVYIIDYKPAIYDDTLWSFIRHRKFRDIREYRKNKLKERKLQDFRKNHLALTQRFKKQKDLKRWNNNLSVLISGSDQVFNESFLQYGESGGSTVYFLDFGGKNQSRYSYAASFGVVAYNQILADKVAPLLANFQGVSARENSGLLIFKQMKRSDAIVVPDPTLLHKRSFYDQLCGGQSRCNEKIRYYFLRKREKQIQSVLQDADACAITTEGIEEWINVIRSSRHLITNSFHGVVFCLIYHIPFSVVLPTKENVGMNDRFYTLLTPLKLTDRIFSEADFTSSSLDCNIEWNDVDTRLDVQREIGRNYLKSIK